MYELIKVSYGKEGEQLVSARELYEFLEVKTRFNDWFIRMCKYGFVENKDFAPITQKRVTAQGNEVTYNDYILKISMAKELSMIQRNDKGKQAREYFVACEEAWNSPDMILARANKILNSKIIDYREQVKLLEKEINKNKYKADFYDSVRNSKDTLDMLQVSKIIGIKSIGRTTLFKILRDNKILMNNNIPYQKYIDNGWFKVIECQCTYYGKYTKIYLKTLVCQKGLENIIKIVKGEKK